VDDVALDGAPALEDATGRLGITFLPGKKLGGRAGRHWRDLDLDLATLRERGVDRLILHVEDEELTRCRVPEIEDVLREGGRPELVRHPIPDPQVPPDDGAYRRLVREIVTAIRDGASVAIACRGGLDRSGMTASCVLVEAGMDPDTAMARVQASREGSITMRDQRAYVRAWHHARHRGDAAVTPGTTETWRDRRGPGSGGPGGSRPPGEDDHGAEPPATANVVRDRPQQRRQRPEQAAGPPALKSQGEPETGRHTAGALGDEDGIAGDEAGPARVRDAALEDHHAAAPQADHSGLGPHDRLVAVRRPVHGILRLPSRCHVAAGGVVSCRSG
jgi:protein-tyrosine phosphatase